MKSVRRHTAALHLPTLRLEGGLFLPDVLEKAALGQARLQTEADYAIPKGLRLKDEYSRAFQIACAQWRSFAALQERSDYDAQHATATFVTELLRDALGYTHIGASTGITLGERHYPITHLATSPAQPGRALPVVVAPHHLGLDEADARFAVAGSGSRKKTAFQLAQELLNASPEHQWAIATNGKTLRLLRDAATLTRPSYLDIDLQDLLSGQRFAEFAYAWRLLHASRAGLQGGQGEQGGAANAPAPVVWEAWREAGQEEGTRVRDGLRQGVTQALITMGQGFVQHPANDALRQALEDGSLTQSAYFAQLLRLIYRCIFTFSVEERGLIPAQPSAEEAQTDPAAARAKVAAAQAYAQGYALARLRDLALRRRARTRFDDLWRGVQIVFKGLGSGEPRLGLPALGGLFAASQCPALDGAQLSNAHLLAAMHSLRWARQPGASLAPIDYRNMGTEELGSVYESLLELVPQVDLHARSFGFVGLTPEGTSASTVAGNDRKLTGSYYTPDSLVQELIRSALDPVIAQRLADNPAHPVQALLAIRVIDPACGSGHFLLAAARRLAERLASLRSPDGAVTPLAYRHALREVTARCIFGVDRNPMAVELARTALWLEGFEEGSPLGFLDHHLQVGDALLGLIDLKVLELGIPKDAFKPLSGDDKGVCKQLAKTNAAALKDLEKKRSAQAFGQLDVAIATGSGLSQLQALEALPDNTTQQVLEKEAAYQMFLEQAQTSRLAHAADLLVGAFLLPKSEGTEGRIPTSATLYLTLRGDKLPAEQQGALAAAQAACIEARVFHWPLIFPQIFANGGFDCVLGNPPWEHVELKEEEFFSNRNPLVSAAKNKAERSQRIQWLSEGMLVQHMFPQTDHAYQESAAEQRLFREFTTARRTLEAMSVFAHIPEVRRYPLTGVGRVNTYALFSETISQILNLKGNAGFIVPSGIATDDSTKLFFQFLIEYGRLISMYGFDNSVYFSDVGLNQKQFCLLTIAGDDCNNPAKLAFYLSKVDDIRDPRREFQLTANEFRLINPNTLTCPIFRSKFDAELIKKIYSTVGVFVDEGRPNGNPWGVRFMQGTHNMSTDSHLFIEKDAEGLLPLYEPKLMHQFDHRWATFINQINARDLTDQEKCDPSISVNPRYWVRDKDVFERFKKSLWDVQWLLGWRGVTATTNSRTFIATVIPLAGAQHNFLLFNLTAPATYQAALLANMNSLILDYVARSKMGSYMSQFVVKQLPLISVANYTNADEIFITQRVLELTYTSDDISAWAKDLGYTGNPFSFDSQRRAQLRAELDAYYAKLYRLTRDELRYVLDPSSVMSDDYPSETFRVLKAREEREFGEYRTQQMVMKAWDKLESGELH